MKTIYPNEKVNLKRGGRNSDKISMEEFNKLLENFYERIKKINPEAEDFEYYYAWIFYCYENLPKIKKDLKYDFDFENIILKEEGITSGGTPYKRFLCGGDWEDGLLVFIYPSNNEIRAYIPSKGNTVRVDLKCVFGSELEIETAENAGVDLQEDRLKYLRKYSNEEIDSDTKTEINFEWCLEDFETRLGER